jgi:hypothetical protein
MWTNKRPNEVMRGNVPVQGLTHSFPSTAEFFAEFFQFQQIGIMSIMSPKFFQYRTMIKCPLNSQKGGKNAKNKIVGFGRIDGNIQSGGFRL